MLADKGAAAPAEIVGSPFYDDISQPDAEQRDEGYVLVASQPDERIERRRSRHSWLRVIFAACGEIGREVILKIHPTDACNIPYYQQLADEAQATVRIARHGEQPLSELMAGTKGLSIEAAERLATYLGIEFIARPRQLRKEE